MYVCKSKNFDLHGRYYQVPRHLWPAWIISMHEPCMLRLAVFGCGCQLSETWSFQVEEDVLGMDDQERTGFLDVGASWSMSMSLSADCLQTNFFIDLCIINADQTLVGMHRILQKCVYFIPLRSIDIFVPYGINQNWIDYNAALMFTIISICTLLRKYIPFELKREVL